MNLDLTHKVSLIGTTLLYTKTQSTYILAFLFLIVLSLIFRKTSEVVNKKIEKGVSYVFLAVFKCLLILIYLFVIIPLSLFNRKNRIPINSNLVDVDDQKLNFDRPW